MSSTSTTPSIITRPLAEQVTWYAEQARSDPRFALVNGIAPMTELPLFGGRERTNASHADWIRGAALALLPRTQRYAIHEDLAGQGVLELLPD